MRIVERVYSPPVAFRLFKEGVPAVLARAFAGRGVRSISEIRTDLHSILPYQSLASAEDAAEILRDAIRSGTRILIVSDYDADGATACAIALRALRAFGANVDYLVPNRLEHGYGLTRTIVRLAAQRSPTPELLVTVDNGISSHEGIEEANRLGIPVLVTDHHLPAATLPAARLVVNPNRGDCSFGSKALAGCGVMWYVLWALEDRLRAEGEHPRPEFSVTSLLPIVALGTVADVVPLDANNRQLVRAGLEQIRNAPTFAGIEALCEIAKKNGREISTADIAFALGPRINAAGRLESMDAGVDCLTTDDPLRARALAESLSQINLQRRQIEAEILEQASQELVATIDADRYTAVASRDGWHAGVIGIVAGRVRERLYRPAFVFAPDATTGQLTGSGRSIAGFHLRDALDLVAKRAPGVLVKYGGHAMAAGATVAPGKLAQFTETFEQIAREKLTPADLGQTLETDGSLDASEMTLQTAVEVSSEVWGQAFPEPLFCDNFRVLQSQPMGEGGVHLRLRLQKDGRTFQAVKFRTGPVEVAPQIRIAYRLSANTYQGETSLQLLVEHLESA